MRNSEPKSKKWNISMVKMNDKYFGLSLLYLMLALVCFRGLNLPSQVIQSMIHFFYFSLNFPDNKLKGHATAITVAAE